MPSALTVIVPLSTVAAPDQSSDEQLPSSGATGPTSFQASEPVPFSVPVTFTLSEKVVPGVTAAFDTAVDRFGVAVNGASMPTFGGSAGSRSVPLASAVVAALFQAIRLTSAAGTVTLKVAVIVSPGSQLSLPVVSTNSSALTVLRSLGGVEVQSATQLGLSAFA